MLSGERRPGVTETQDPALRGGTRIQPGNTQQLATLDLSLRNSTREKTRPRSLVMSLVTQGVASAIRGTTLPGFRLRGGSSKGVPKNPQSDQFGRFIGISCFVPGHSHPKAAHSRLRDRLRLLHTPSRTRQIPEGYYTVVTIPVL